jgi:acyl-coenzyme A thioesterase PaaI-like protein
MLSRMSRQGTPSVDELAAGAEPPAFFPYLGMTVERVDDEEAVVRMDTPPALMSPYGPVHGGAIAALIDTAIGVAVGRRLGEG